MTKTYTDEEINSLIDELQKELPEILKAEAVANAEELVKAEGKQYPAAKEGGNGTKPEVRGNSNLGKGAQSMGKADDEPKAEPAKDESGDSAPPSDSAASASPDASSAPAASPSPAADASASPAGAADPAMAGGDPAMDPAMAGGDPSGMNGAGDQGGTLEAAYEALSDDEFKAHMQALMTAAMAKMGAQAMGGSPVMGGGSPAPAGDMSAMGAMPPGGSPPASPPPAPDASAMPPPAAKAMPAPMAPPMAKVAPSPGMVVKSEPNVKEEALTKAEERISGLEKTLESVTKILETVLTKPSQKSVTSMAEYIAKSAPEPRNHKLSRSELMKAASDLSRNPTLKDSDRDVINRFVLSGEGVADLEKLLKQ